MAYLELDLLLSYACLMMMTASTVCAAFRWFHMCHPYDENLAHFYPARRLVTTFFLCQLLNSPFLLRPSLQTSVPYAASVELLLCSAFIMLIFNKFFGRRLPHKRIATAILVLSPLAFTAATGLGLTIMPEKISPLTTRWQPLVIGAFAFVLNINILMTMLWVVRKIDRYHRAEFSCEDDFPYAFARKLIWLPWLVLALCWLTMLTRSAALLTLLWLALAVFSVYYTIIILRPQIGKLSIDIEGEEEEKGEEVEDETNINSPSPSGEGRDGAFRESIRRRVIEIARSRYLEPYLTRRDIVGQFDYGERTLAGQIITSYGFYDMINALRLHHARLYQAAHPNETKESVATKSGFKDRFALRHAEHRITLQHPEILEGFTPKGV